MVAIGRALMARPRLICMDEPSMGLSPLYVEQIFDIIQEINRQGIDDLHGGAERQHGAAPSPTAPMCCRPGRWCSPAPRRNCGRTETIREAYLGEMQGGH